MGVVSWLCSELLQVVLVSGQCCYAPLFFLTGTVGLAGAHAEKSFIVHLTGYTDRRWR